MPSIRRVISLDTETTGKDFFHGVKPFFVTVCFQDGQQRWWQWLVDPKTRQPEVNTSDVLEIQATIDAADEICLHGAKFDAHALRTVGITLPFEKTRCTLNASHLLASNHPHNLTDTVIEYLGVDILRYEKCIENTTKACRQSIKRNEWLRFGVDTSAWRLAEEGAEGMPSVGGGTDEDKPWKNDLWVAESLAAALLGEGVDLEDADFPQVWLDAPREYANVDSAVTLSLWLWMEEEIKSRGLWSIYLEKMKLPRIAFDMERNGATISGYATNQLIDEYSGEVQESKNELEAIAHGRCHDLELPAGASPNDSIREMFYGSTRLECPKCGTVRKHKAWVDGEVNGQIVCPKCLKRKGRLVKDGMGGKVRVNGPEEVHCSIKRNPCFNAEVLYDAKTGSPTLNKEAMLQYQLTSRDEELTSFVQTLGGMRSRQTAVSYATSYKRFWVPTGVVNERGEQLWYRLHSSFNITGTDTLRWSSSDPNLQNVSRKEDFNLRRCFGPALGREWWSMDGKNLELRIPAYESGEPSLIALFERPDDPPFYGSQHLLNFSVVYEDVWADAVREVGIEKAGPYCKKQYASTYYVWCKGGDFAIQYQCGEATADRAFRRQGAFRKLKETFYLLEKLNQRCLAFALKNGYVETMVDHTVCTERGYPILVGRGEDGKIRPTTPLNYRVSGTAMQWTNKAMVRCDERIRQWNAAGWDGFLTLQIHDELVFDCPRGDGAEPWKTNLGKMLELKELMERGGTDVGVPTPVSVEFHPVSYAEGMAI